MPTRLQKEVAAEERAEALLRAIVPESEFRYNAVRDARGRIRKRVPTHLEFTGQSGKIYQIYLHTTTENIVEVAANGRKVKRHCVGPWTWIDYIDVEVWRNQHRLNVDQELWQRSRDASDTRGLPRWDIFLGQYLALKYDERRFLSKAISSYY
jgi:hypothetical protein